MRTSFQEEALELARMRVEGAQKIVDAQRQRVKWLRNRDFPDERALRVLSVYERSLEQLKKRLEFLETRYSTVSKAS